MADYDPRNLEDSLVHQSHFTDEKTEAQGVCMPRLHSYLMKDPGLEFGKFLDILLMNNKDGKKTSLLET